MFLRYKVEGKCFKIRIGDRKTMTLMFKDGQPTFQYDNEEELSYNFLSAMGLSVRNGIVIDKEYDPNGTVLKLGRRIIKANIGNSDSEIHYAGENESLLEMTSNIHLLNILFGWYLEKKNRLEGKECLVFNPEDTAPDENGIRKTHMCIQFRDGDRFESDYYYNKCLLFPDLIFRMEEMNVDLHNFDSTDFLQEKGYIRN